jgi:acetoin utilization deacetylase AcuC-like enzyme
MLKYELIPGQLIHEGSIQPNELFAPTPCADELILAAHTADYLQKIKEQTLSAREQRVIGFPQSPELSMRELMITQGTINCALYALQHGVALNIAGGTHHAFANRGEGFCMLNDFAVAAYFLLYKQLAKKILIVDLDVHQGNGTASIFANEPRVFTFSMHGAHNYPFRKETSDLDIPLPDGIQDEAYLGLLKHHLPALLESVAPDFVFYLSGVDILDTDRFGKLKVSMQGCKKRDELVFSMLKAKQIPCAVSMGGGYSADVRIITEAHCNTFRLAKDFFE